MLIDVLLDDIDVLDEYVKQDFQRLYYTTIEAVSKQGTPDGAALIDGRWIPKSQLRCDFDKHLYVSHWMYSKL